MTLATATANTTIASKSTTFNKTKRIKTFKSHKFAIDCSKPVTDGIFDMAAFEKFLHDRIKVQGKTGNFGDHIVLTRSGSMIHVRTSNVAFSKRYLKYLSKKFLKKNTLRDWLRVIASEKNTYQLRYFNIEENEETAETAEE